jgi:hypothetical protein
MARAVALVLLGLLCCALAQDNCNLSFKCVKEGDSCQNAANCGQSGQPACVGCKDSVCVTGTCAGGANKGEACAAAGPVCTGGVGAFDKYFPLADTCLSGKCGTVANPLFPGDSCSTSDPLIQGSNTNGGCLGTTCENNVCKSTPAGGNCSGLADAPCAQGYICSVLVDGSTPPFTCVQWRTAGQQCTSTAVCAPNLVCAASSSTSNKTCTTLFSVASGSYCDPSAVGAVGENGDSASLVCNKGLTCTGGSSPTCQDPSDKPIGKSCSSVADCGSSSLYACVDIPCTTKSECSALYIRSDEGVATDYENYVDCLNTNNCASFNVWTSGSSGGSNCANNQCFDKWQTYRDDLPYTFGLCGSGAATIIPAAVLAVVALLFLLF